MIVRFSIVLGNPALCSCRCQIASTAMGLFPYQIYVFVFVVAVVIVIYNYSIVLGNRSLPFCCSCQIASAASGLFHICGCLHMQLQFRVLSDITVGVAVVALISLLVVVGSMYAHCPAM